VNVSSRSLKTAQCLNNYDSDRHIKSENQFTKVGHTSLFRRLRSQGKDNTIVYEPQWYEKEYCEQQVGVRRRSTDIGLWARRGRWAWSTSVFTSATVVLWLYCDCQAIEESLNVVRRIKEAD